MTLRFPEDISYRDMHQWLDGGVFIVDVDGEYRVCVNAMPQEDGSINYMLDTGSVYVGTRNSAVLSWPVMGWVTLETGSVAHVTRPNNPGHRLYSRVMSPELIEAAIPIVEDPTVQWGSYTFRSMGYRSLFFPTYPKTMDKALSAHRAYGSVALSTTCCIVRNVFFIGRTPVALVLVGEDIEVSGKVESYKHSLKPVNKALDKLRRA